MKSATLVYVDFDIRSQLTVDYSLWIEQEIGRSQHEDACFSVASNKLAAFLCRTAEAVSQGFGGPMLPLSQDVEGISRCRGTRTKTLH